jgi:hypothetical protein
MTTFEPRRLVTAGGALALLAIVAAGTGCATGRADLEAAPLSNAIAGGKGVVGRVLGVEVRAVAARWTGPVDIGRAVTPMHVTIENESDQPLSVQYPNFALVSPDGVIYSALPPLQVDSDVSREVGPAAARPVPDPAFNYDRYLVAPYYGRYYPEMRVAAPPYIYDPDYYRTYYEYWVDIDLPTERMMSLALPDGRLEPNGQVSGWLYFEHVDPDEDQLRFRADLVDAASGRKLGEVTMPFVVADL